VFFGIEGCMKADAILSAGEAVFSVPAVGQWRAPELRAFAKRYLKDKLVVIVPDADWYVKDEVIRQARECKEHLEYDLGIDALIAAPPRAGLPKIKGIDDYLGPDGRGTLEGLEVIDFQLDPIAEAYMLSWPRVRRDAVLNSLKVLRALALRADRQGRVKMSDRAISKRVGISHKAIGG
jgi:hypothetical protein